MNTEKLSKLKIVDVVGKKKFEKKSPRKVGIPVEGELTSDLLEIFRNFQSLYSATNEKIEYFIISKDSHQKVEFVRKDLVENYITEWYYKSKPIFLEGLEKDLSVYDDDFKYVLEFIDLFIIGESTSSFYYYFSLIAFLSGCQILISDSLRHIFKMGNFNFPKIFFENNMLPTHMVAFGDFEVCLKLQTKTQKRISKLLNSPDFDNNATLEDFRTQAEITTRPPPVYFISINECFSCRKTTKEMVFFPKCGHISACGECSEGEKIKIGGKYKCLYCSVLSDKIFPVMKK